MARSNTPKASSLPSSRARRPASSPREAPREEPREEPDVFAQLAEEPELTPEQERARDQGTLRFFAVLLAVAELAALGWAVRSHAPRGEYLAVAGACLLLFGLPTFLAWRSLARVAEP